MHKGEKEIESTKENLRCINERHVLWSSQCSTDDYENDDNDVVFVVVVVDKNTRKKNNIQQHTGLYICIYRNEIKQKTSSRRLCPYFNS